MKNFILLICAFSLFQLRCKNQSDQLEQLLKEQINKYPKITVQDIYKLLYQSNYGVKHLLKDTVGAKNYLFMEMSEIQAINEPLTENISFDRSIIRINLKSFKFKKLNADILFEVMKKSAAEINGSDDVFRYNWSNLKLLVKNGKLNLNILEIENYENQIKKNVSEEHHSETFIKEYNPSYRVVKKDIFYNYFSKNLD